MAIPHKLYRGRTRERWCSCAFCVRCSVPLQLEASLTATRRPHSRSSGTFQFTMGGACNSHFLALLYSWVSPSVSSWRSVIRAALSHRLGSIPFILKENLSYSQLATFALSGYPYSLKLLWSPIVDSVFFVSVGRRKSWIIPMQLIVGTIMLYLSVNVQVLMDDVSNHFFPVHDPVLPCI